MDLEQFKFVKSIDDLKKIGSENDIKNLVEELITPIKIKADTYNEILEIILLLKEKWVDLIDGPFINKKNEYVFYLTKMEGKQRNRNLGITQDLYENIELAKKWYLNLSKYVHPDVSCDKNGEAFKTLSEIYKVMTDESEEI